MFEMTETGAGTAWEAPTLPREVFGGIERSKGGGKAKKPGGGKVSQHWSPKDKLLLGGTPDPLGMSQMMDRLGDREAVAS